MMYAAPVQARHFGEAAFASQPQMRPEVRAEHSGVYVSAAQELRTADVQASAVSSSHTGQDFRFSFPGTSGADQALLIWVTGEPGTTGIVSIADASFPPIEYSITARLVASITLPGTPGSTGHPASAQPGISTKSIRVTSTADVSVYPMNYMGANTDGFLGMPSSVAGRDYVIPSYPISDLWNGTSVFAATSSSMGHALVVAVEDETQITVTHQLTTGVARSYVGDRGTGKLTDVVYVSTLNATPPISTMVLNAGEVFVRRVISDDLSGTTVESSKPVMVHTTRRAVGSPVGYAFGGAFIENAPPTAFWGKRYVAVPTPGRNWGDTFRLYAAQSGTAVYVNGRALGTIGRGQWIEYRTQTIETKLFTSTEPIMVQQQMNSGVFDGVTGSKPSMQLVVPLEQGLMTYTISTPKDKLYSGNEFVNKLNIAVPAAGDVRIYVDGVIVTSLISNSFGILTATVSITPGAHTVTGSIPFVLSVLGTRNNESYIYPGGSNYAQLDRVNSVTLTPNEGSYLVSKGSRCFVAQVSYDDSSGVPGVPVYFQKTDGTYLAGGNADETGRATICYTGAAGDSGLKVVAGWSELSADVSWRSVANADANLTDLQSDSMLLFPTFVSTTSYYTVHTTDAAAAFTVTLSDSNAVYTLTSSPEACAPASGGDGYAAVAHSCALAYGDNSITVTVVAEDQSTTKDYLIVIRRLLNDAHLIDLDVAPGELTPAFVSGTTEYSVVVENAVSSLTVTPTLADSDAVYTITGSPGTCGLATCTLSEGENVITVTVSTELGTTQDYVVTVTRARISSDANLRDLEMALDSSTPLGLTPAFISSTYEYATVAPFGVTLVEVTALTNDGGATVTYKSSAGACTGASPATCVVSDSKTWITVTVTAADGVSKEEYFVELTEAHVSASSDANLLDLEIDPGTLDPMFVSSTMSYTVNVPFGVTLVEVTALKSDVSATVAYESSAGACTEASPAACAVSDSETWITVTVTAADGVSSEEYFIKITEAHENASSDATLLDLEIDPGALNPMFVSSTTSYAANAPSGTRSVVVTALTRDVTATVSYESSAGACTGARSDDASVARAHCAVADTTTWITVTVTAADGVSSEEYFIEITESHSDASSDANLSDLEITLATSSGSRLTPAFVSSTHKYAAVAPNDTTSMLVTALTSDVSATVRYESSAGACTGVLPATCAVSGPKTWITTEVTAVDGSSQDYVIVVTLEVPSVLLIGHAWPATGVPAGGMPVTILGSGFVGALSVTVDGQEVSFTVVSDVRIDIVMPPGVDGQSVDIIVHTPTANEIELQAFTYVAPEVFEVDAATGGVVTATGGVTLVVPPQTGVNGTLVITVEAQTPAAQTPGTLLMHSFVVQVTLNGQPYGALGEALTLTLEVDPSVVPAGETPTLYAWVAAWTRIPGQTYSASTRQVTGRVTRSGRYAVSTVLLREYWLPVVPVVR